MSLERNTTTINKDLNPVKNWLDTASVAKIADFFNKTIEKKQLENPMLGFYELCEKIVSDHDKYPSRIRDDVRQKALEAMSSENADTKLAGKNAFLFLSLRSILGVVDSVLTRKKSSNENRDEMFMSAALFVFKYAPGLRDKDQISTRVTGLAESGILTYLFKRNNKFLGSHNLIKSISLEENEETLEEAEGVEEPEAEEDLEDVVTKIDIANFLLTLYNVRKSDKINNERKTSHQIEVIRRLYGLDDGVERAEKEVGREFGVGGAAISPVKKKALNRLKYPDRRKKLEGYH